MWLSTMNSSKLAALLETFYWSSITQRKYQVSFAGTFAGNNATDPYAALMLYEKSQGLYLPVLFDGAYDCTLEGKSGGASVVVNVNADGMLGLSCLSVLPIYLPETQGAVLRDGKCPFGSANYESMMTCKPTSYINYPFSGMTHCTISEASFAIRKTQKAVQT